MIQWLSPIALVGLLATAGPIVVHLLLRRRAGRLSFPSVRFIPRAHTSSTRFRMPSDRVLLLLRIAVVAVAAAALAQPFVVTTTRRDSWAERMSRAVVVDARVSSFSPATHVVAAESQAGDTVVHVRGPSLSNGVRDAVDALSDLPPSRQEIVVVSDFRHGALTAVDIAAVPERIGLRFIPVEAPSVAEEFSGDATLGARGVPARVQTIRATPQGTDVRVTIAARTGDGLRLETTPDRAGMLLRAVARAGAPAADSREPIAIIFDSNNAVDTTEGTQLAAWMLRTVLRMRHDSDLLDAARTHVHKRAISDLPGVVVARNAEDVPVIAAAQRQSELVLNVAAPPEAFLSAATLRSALVARRGEPRWDDREIVRTSPSTLERWTRAPGTIDVGNTHPRAPGDARWVWALVVGLLVLETFVRKQRTEPRESRYVDAA